MSDPKNIKRQTSTNSEGVTPEEATKDLDEIKDEDLGKAAGGGGVHKVFDYADFAV